MVAFTLAGFPVYLYPLSLALGALIGLVSAAWAVRTEDARLVVDVAAWTLLGALVGGRAMYVWMAWPAFSAEPLRALQVGLGGLAWPGALAGALLALFPAAWLARRPTGALADALTPLLAAISVAAWAASVPEGVGYGPPTTWGGLPAPDEWGASAARWPVQALCAVLCLMVFWMVDRVPRRAAAVPGLRACLMLLGLALAQWIAAVSASPERLWHGLPPNAWAAMLLAVFALIGLGLTIRFNRGRGIE